MPEAYPDRRRAVRRFVVLFVLLLGGMVLFNAGFGVYLRPLLYTLTPLQRYYLDAYLASSWKAKDPTATTEIEWVWKIKPKGKKKTDMEFAREEDLVPWPPSKMLWQGDTLPFGISQEATADGWLTVIKGMPAHVNSAQLQPVLQDGFFDGKPAWEFFVQPLLVLAAAFGLWLLYRVQQTAYMEQNWWKPVPLWLRVGRKVLASGSGAVRTLQAPQTQLALPTPNPGPVILEQIAPQPKAKPAPKPEPVAPVPAPVQQAKPAAPVTVQPKPKQTFWDESKGLD